MSSSDKEECNPNLLAVPEKSKRKSINSEWDSGHFQTVKLSSEAQSFLSKRLAKALTKQIRFVTTEDMCTSESKMEDTTGIFLFNHSSEPISRRDLEDLNEDANGGMKRKKYKLKKRKLDDEAESEDESTKLKSVAVSFDWVKNGKY